MNMTIEEVKSSYNKVIESESIKLSKVKKQIFTIGTIRLLLVLACIATCIVVWPALDLVGITIIGVIILFLPLMKYHSKLFSEKRYLEILVQNAKDELKGIDYDFSAFDGAPEYSDGKHSYSLDLDIFGERSFFQSLNRTVTESGKKQLADSILNPSRDKNEILSHQEIIKELSQKPELIAHFRAMGGMYESKDFDHNKTIENIEDTSSISKSFWKFMPAISTILSLTIAISAYLDFIPMAAFFFYWTVMIVVALLPSKKIKKNLDFFGKKLEVVQIYTSLLQIIENEKFESASLKKLQENVSKPESAYSAIKQLKKLGDNMYISYTIVGILLFSPFFAWNVYFAMKIEKWIFKHKDDITKWFEVVAQFDSFTSQAIYAYNHPDYTYPEIADTFKLEAKNMGHPMINRNICVRNDINIPYQSYFMVVTGANMAGKSTYLRTVGINLILAEMGLPVCATSFQFYPFQLVTNLRTSDSLNDNESYFFAELKRLKMIIDRLDAGEELFIILDEILKGTNSEDKQKGSIALMKQLVSLNGNGIIATHDLELGNLEKEFPESVKDYRFEADISGDNLSFSYKMREGVAQNMNACFLMKKMGITGL